MSKEVRLFKSEERRTRTEASTFLHDLAGKLDSGEVILRQGAEELTLMIPESVILEIQVEDETKKSKGVQHSLELEIKWYDDDAQAGPLELG